MKNQTFRRIYTEAENKLGKNSEAYEYFWEIVEVQDKILEEEVIIILDTYGWLGISRVGRFVNGTQIDYNSNETPTFYAIEKPEYINERRKEIGLEKIQDFAKRRGLKWTILQKNK